MKNESILVLADDLSCPSIAHKAEKVDNDPDELLLPIGGLGGLAVGMEALPEFLTSMQIDSGMAFVVMLTPSLRR